MCDNGVMTNKNPTRTEVNDVADRIPMADVRKKYTEWWKKIQAANREFLNSPEAQDGEDLSDFVEGIETIFSFGPTPYAFEEACDDEVA